MWIVIKSTLRLKTCRRGCQDQNCCWNNSNNLFTSFLLKCFLFVLKSILLQQWFSTLLGLQHHHYWHTMFCGTLNRYELIMCHPFKPNLLKVTYKVYFCGIPTHSYSILSTSTSCPNNETCFLTFVYFTEIRCSRYTYLNENRMFTNIVN